MFEKEAEKHADGIYHYKINVSDYGEDGIINYRYSDVKEAYQKGAEFGYNKANEWHYVKDGDLPKDEDWKLCVSYRGYYYVAKYEEMFGCWTNQEYSEVMQPYAWKEIVLPELKESE